MKCKFCERLVFIKFYYLKMYFCEEYFIEYFERKVKRMIECYKMFKFDEKVLVVVSGGKDLVVIVYVFKKFGYNIECFYINFGIGEYLEKGERYVRE